MSYGHGRSNAGIETEGNALCDALASGEGWTQDDDGRDLCAGCPARKDTR